MQGYNMTTSYPIAAYNFSLLIVISLSKKVLGLNEKDSPSLD